MVAISPPNAGAASGGREPEDAERRQSCPSSGVRYGAMNWIGEFRWPPQAVSPCGGKVVIQSDRGIELGETVRLTCAGCHPSVGQAQIREYVANSGGEFYRHKAGRILRAASVQDQDEHQRLNSHVREDVERCDSLASELALDMKVITAEHLLGGERIVFYFRSEGRIDFRELVRGLARHYQTRIEMRQVGARDEARLLADYEVCGRECCCKNFLKKLRPITMRMAKLQKSTLDPSKVSGRCGRLRCCLRYEHEGYDELARNLPRVGTRVQCEMGPATVIDRQVLTQLVLVRGDDERQMAIPVDELSPLGAARPKPAAPLPEAEAPAVAPGAEEPGPAEQAERPPRRRRPRRRRKSSDNDRDRTPATAAPADSASEALPAPAEKESPESGSPARRRRRRRRRRRGRPGASSGSGEN